MTLTIKTILWWLYIKWVLIYIFDCIARAQTYSDFPKRTRRCTRYNHLVVVIIFVSCLLMFLKVLITISVIIFLYQMVELLIVKIHELFFLIGIQFVRCGHVWWTKYIYFRCIVWNILLTLWWACLVIWSWGWDTLIIVVRIEHQVSICIINIYLAIIIVSRTHWIVLSIVSNYHRWTFFGWLFGWYNHFASHY